MSFIDLASKIRVRCGRKKTGSPTLYSQPGAHTGDTRQYIPGYSDSNIIFRAPTTGNDANDGLTAGTPKQTKSACDTAAGSTKKIRIIEACTLNESVSKPTEMLRGVSGTISSSLTDPVASLTAAATPGWTSGAPARVTWSPKLKKWYAVGSTQIVSSSDGDTWTLEYTLSGTGATRIIWVDVAQRLYVVGTNGKVLYSADGTTWTSTTVGSDTFNAIAYSDELSLYLVGERGKIYVSSNGEDWTQVVIDTPNLINSIVAAFGYVFAFDSSGNQLRSSDGYNWTKTTPFNGYAVNAAAYMSNVGLLIAADTDGEIFSTADGTTWTSRRAATANECYDVIYIKETGYAVVCDGGRILTRSVNGTSWTSTAALAAYGVGDQIRGIAYSPLRGQIITTGGNDGATTRINAYGPLYGNTISASIAGFTVQAVQYSGTVTAYNCTMKQPGTTAALSLNACRLTESGAHISNNAQSHFGTLVEGDFNITCTPASQNAVAINCNTIAGRLSVFNASSTLYEQIRDNIIDGGFYASYACLIQSGNLRGTYTNATLSNKVSNGQDPVFVDEADYKIKRITNGDSQDSPLCNAALYYVNEAGYDRDVGAWSYDDTDNATEYQRTFYLNKPAGNGISITKVQSANAYQGDSGEWDSYNNPARASEHLTLTYQSAVPVDHIDFQDYFESLDDMTCEVNLDPQNDSPSTDITVNGNHAIGDVVLNIDASTTIKGGMHFTTGGNTYYAVYVTPAGNATKIILDRPLVAAISDNTSITPASVAGDGEYQYLPQNRDGKRPMGQETEYLGGCVFKFVRPWQ